MIKTILIVVAVIFSFVVLVIALGINHTFAQFDKFEESRAIPLSTKDRVNMTDEMKSLCIKMDASNAIDQIKDKEQYAQCKKFLDNVSIYELKELIDKYFVK
jgi:hypothetical protein